MGEAVISAGRDAKGNAVATGAGASAVVTYHETIQVNPEIDIVAVLQSLKGAFAAVPGIDSVPRAITRIDDALDEARKPDPQPAKIGELIREAVGFVKQVSGFGENVATLVPLLQQVGSWLGQTWDHW